MKLVHRQLLLAELETTYNTDPVPTAAVNSILVQDVTYSDVGLKMAARPAIRGNSIADLQSIYAGQLRQLTFTCEVKGSGTAGTVPEIDPLLQACGMSETTVASTSVTYAPESSTSLQKSVTMYLYLDGSLMKITGARGNVKFTAKVGEIVTAEFTMVGHISSDYTDIALPAATVNATVPVAALDLAVTYDSYSPTCSSVSMDAGMKVEQPEVLNSVDGYGELIIGSRKVTIDIDPQLDNEADFNWFTGLTAGNVGAFTTGAIGSVAGNIITFDFPTVYVSKITDSKSNGIITANITLDAIETAGSTDTDFSIKFT